MHLPEIPLGLRRKAELEVSRQRVGGTASERAAKTGVKGCFTTIISGAPESSVTQDCRKAHNRSIQHYSVFRDSLTDADPHE